MIFAILTDKRSNNFIQVVSGREKSYLLKEIKQEPTSEAIILFTGAFLYHKRV